MLEISLAFFFVFHGSVYDKDLDPMITLNKRFKTPVRKIFPRFIACRRLRIQGRCRNLLRLCWPLQVFFSLWHKSPSGAFSACARYKSMLHKLDQRSKPEHRAHGCLRHGERRDLYSVRKRWRTNGSVQSETDKSSGLTLSRNALELLKTQRNLNRSVFLIYSRVLSKILGIPTVF